MDLIDLQNRVVMEVAAAAPAGGWERIVADVEIEESTEGYQFDSVSFAITRAPDGTLSDPQFSLSRAARDAIIELYKQRKDTGDVLGGFALQIDYPGRYKFDFSYDKPKRLNGVWDKEKEERLDHYLEHYRRETDN